MSAATHHIIPDGESFCVWMDAGLVNYKLCKYNFDCEQCEFDGVMRTQKGADAGNTALPARPAESVSGNTLETSLSVDEYLAKTMLHMMQAITSLPLPEDRLYSENHTWVKRERDDLYVLGIDHFIGHMLSTAHSVAFPQPPTHIRAHEPYAWIVANGETLAVRSPIAGTIVEVNTSLIEQSTLIHTDPYTLGWLAKIRPKHKTHIGALMKAPEFIALLERDSERFKQDVNAEIQIMQTQLHGTMHDGGTVLDNFEAILGPKKYYAIAERFTRP